MSADVELARIACGLACGAHAGQRRRGSGDPYIAHLARVAAALDDPYEKALAWLHDVLEDTPLSVYDIQTLLGAEQLPTSDLLADLLTLTHPPSRTYAEYIDDLVDHGSLAALRVKRADLNDNIEEGERYPSLFAELVAGRWKPARRRVEAALARLALLDPSVA